VFEAEDEEGDVMDRPPRDPQGPLLGGGLAASALAQGLAVAIGLAALQGTLIWAGWADAQVRAVVFTALVACTVAMIFVNRSFGGPLGGGAQRQTRLGTPLAVALGATSGLMALVLAVPALRELFLFAPLEPLGLALALGTALLLGALLSAGRAAMRPRPQLRAFNRGL
jgi:Ca2+-transporting ATPase